MSLESKKLLLGGWRLLEAEFRYEGDRSIYPWGKKPLGHLVYSPDGYMSAVLSRFDRPRFVSDDIVAGTPDELAQAAYLYVSYGGTYEIGEENRVTHHVEVALNPNLIGQPLIRYIEEITERLLVLRTIPTSIEGNIGTGYLTWSHV